MSKTKPPAKGKRDKSTPRLAGLRIDIETRSSEDLKHGVYRYVESFDFDILTICYSPIRQYPNGVTKLGYPVELTPEREDNFKKILVNPRFQKHAFNAAFERVALGKGLFDLPEGTYLDPEGWYCTAAKANVNGVFGTLDEVGRAVRSPTAKDKEGKRLIKLFSQPDAKYDLFHNGQTKRCWCGVDHAEDFAKFIDYCKQDVVMEAVVARAFPAIPEQVQREYEADQRINDRGIRHHRRLSQMALAQVEAEKDRLMSVMRDLTGIENPNSGPQVHAWLETQGYVMNSLDKDARYDALMDPLCPENVAELLTLKGAASLSSVTKHKAMLNTRSSDGRIRGSLRFYGAHTGREAGRGFQPQNLPRAEATEAERKRLLKGKAGADAPEIAKGTVRSALIPAKGHVFVTADYNAIEARCLGWEAGEDWVNAEFDTARGGRGKIYEATAHMMFGVDKLQLIDALSACGKCGNCQACSTRGKGKVSNLALGYNGGAGALVTMGAEREGIDCGNYVELHHLWKLAGAPGKFWEWEKESHDYPELLRLRDLYREASPATVRFWKLCANAWDASTAGHSVRFGANNILAMVRDGKHNRLVLPSGRSIWYRFARSHYSDTNEDRVERRTFIGKSAGVGHVRTDTHGGKITENITQAVARDVLFDLLLRIEAKTAKGWPAQTVLHVHDEVVLEVPEKHADQVLADTIGMMAKSPSWAAGLALKGEGSIMERYKK